jgi:hypothetical protein
MADPPVVAHVLATCPRPTRVWDTKAGRRLDVVRAANNSLFEWDGRRTRVTVALGDQGRAKSAVAVADERLADLADAESANLDLGLRLVD